MSGVICAVTQGLGDLAHCMRRDGRIRGARKNKRTCGRVHDRVLLYTERGERREEMRKRMSRVAEGGMKRA